MKHYITVLICVAFIFGTNSCLVLVEKDHGKHHGWHNKNKPKSHPKTSNPGKGKHKSHPVHHPKKK